MNYSQGGSYQLQMQVKVLRITWAYFSRKSHIKGQEQNSDFMYHFLKSSLARKETWSVWKTWEPSEDCHSTCGERESVSLGEYKIGWGGSVPIVAEPRCVSSMWRHLTTSHPAESKGNLCKVFSQGRKSCPAPADWSRTLTTWHRLPEPPLVIWFMSQTHTIISSFDNPKNDEENMNNHKNSPHRKLSEF